MPEADLELPYEGAKEMLLVDDIDNREFLGSLLEAMYGELPAPKKNNALAKSELYSKHKRRKMNSLESIGEFVEIYDHKVHVYRTGNPDKPKLVLMSKEGANCCTE